MVMSARERLEARRRIERLLDEDRRQVAPPPEKATTPVGWLDHECRCCNLEGATTTSSFGSVDDERRRTAGRRKPDNESGKTKEITAAGDPLVQSWVHVAIARQSFTLPLPVGQNRETGGKGGGRKLIGGGVHPSGAPLRRADGQRGGPVGRGGAPTARRPATEGGETAQGQRNCALGSGGDSAGGVDGGTLPDALVGTTRTAVLAADPGDDRQGESLCCWLTTTTARIRGIRGAS